MTTPEAQTPETPYQNLILTGYMGTGKTNVGRLIALTKAARSTINARRHLTSSSIGRLSGQTPFEPGELIDDCLLNLLDRLLRVGRTHLSLSNALLGIR